MLDPNHFGAGPFGHIRHPLAKLAIDRDHRHLARLEQVHDRRLHRSGSGRGKGQTDMVRRLEQGLQTGLGLFHKRLKSWIKMTNSDAGMGLKHTLRDLGRTGTH